MLSKVLAANGCGARPGFPDPRASPPASPASLGTPDTDISQARLSSQPNPTTIISGQASEDHPSSQYRQNQISPPVVDRADRASSTSRLTQLPIVAQGLPESPPFPHQIQPDHISPRNWPDTWPVLPPLAELRHGSVLGRWQYAAKSIDRCFSSSLIAQPSDEAAPSHPSVRLFYLAVHAARVLGDALAEIVERVALLHLAVFIHRLFPAIARDPLASRFPASP
ncbi:hypothetical protein PtA15_7A286 [Puccinia triticina]|uniref:Uncharacterized protein n=1 Tax=Puccinia triticina TaxID=208348 RepID=A0ABY7CNE4_9BASI|nr:uncharacterized protein PtA15_7A286 [Puccinia triticina]WAQ86560.1 hypothetical protein PtA15_7A286 [Puccinia triticina]WAR56421.1 hypothetical protein PtB15_7B270 [Puccinia triticina]